MCTGNYLFLCVSILVCTCTERLKQLWEDTRESRTLGVWSAGLQLQAFHVLESTLYILSREGAVASSNTYNTT